MRTPILATPILAILIIAILVCTTMAQVSGQTGSPKYERGTILAVVRHQTDLRHQNQEGSDPGVAQYDVSVQVRDTVFTVLYTPPNGANGVEYSAGIDLLVLIGQDTLTFPSKLSGTTVVPILQKKVLPAQDTLDWSKAPSQYFAMKMRHLTASLELSDDQQARIKPIAEQEAGEAGQVLFTTTVPRQERLKQWEKIVRASDAKMKVILSQAQWDRLQEIRKQQKRDLKELIANKDAGN